MLHREWRMKERYPEPVIDVKALETAVKDIPRPKTIFCDVSKPQAPWWRAT